MVDLREGGYGTEVSTSCMIVVVVVVVGWRRLDNTRTNA